MYRDYKSVYNEDTFGKKIHIPIKTPQPIKSEKELKERNGEVMTINLNKPMTKAQFYSLSDYNKKLYIQILREKYQPTNKDIAAMLKIDNSTLGKIAKDIGCPNPDRHKRSYEQVKAWHEFLNGGKATPTETAPVAEQPPEPPTPPKPEPKESKYDFRCNSVCFETTGELDAVKLYKQITTMFPEGTLCKVNIRIEAISAETGESDV